MNSAPSMIAKRAVVGSSTVPALPAADRQIFLLKREWLLLHYYSYSWFPEHPHRHRCILCDFNSAFNGFHPHNSHIKSLFLILHIVSANIFDSLPVVFAWYSVRTPISTAMRPRQSSSYRFYRIHCLLKTRQRNNQYRWIETTVQEYAAAFLILGVLYAMWYASSCVWCSDGSNFYSLWAAPAYSTRASAMRAAILWNRKYPKIILMEMALISACFHRVIANSMLREKIIRILLLIYSSLLPFVSVL